MIVNHIVPKIGLTRVTLYLAMRDNKYRETLNLTHVLDNFKQGRDF